MRKSRPAATAATTTLPTAWCGGGEALVGRGWRTAFVAAGGYDGLLKFVDILRLAGVEHRARAGKGDQCRVQDFINGRSNPKF